MAGKLCAFFVRPWGETGGGGGNANEGLRRSAREGRTNQRNDDAFPLRLLKSICCILAQSILGQAFVHGFTNRSDYIYDTDYNG